MHRPWTLALSACLSVASALGCSSSQPLGSDAGGAGPSSSGAAGTNANGDSNAGGSAGAAHCDAPGYHVDSNAIQIDKVTAQLDDPSGAAVPNLLVQVCGLDVCFNGMTNQLGNTSVAPNMGLLRPAFKYGDGFDFAKLAALLSTDSTQDLGQLVALPLPDYSAGAPFPKSGNVSNGDLTLVLADGGSVTHDLLTYTDDSQLVFRNVPIPLAASTKAADPSLGFEVAYAVAPVSTVFCPAAGLQVKNTLGWAAGVAVEVFVQGLEVDEHWAPYGAWQKVADASVTADGSTITTTSGGIPILSSIALRRK